MDLKKWKKDIALVYMVAGMSSRFGGKIKQFAKVGANGETLIEVSLKQALREEEDIRGDLKEIKEELEENEKILAKKRKQESLQHVMVSAIIIRI